MKILVVTIFPPEIGGPATQASHLCEALRRAGHEPVVVAFDPHRSFRERRDGIRVYRVRLPREGEASVAGRASGYLSFARRLNRILAVERPDIVHCNVLGGYALLVGVLARLRRIPTVVKFASDMVWEVLNRRGLTTSTIEEAHGLNARSRMLAAYQRLTLGTFTVVWATSEYRRRTLIDLVGVEPGRIRVLPNYIRLEETNGNGSRGGSEAVRLLSGGRFVPHKRFEDLIHALARIPDTRVEVHLYGGGNPRVEKGIRELAARLGVADRVHLHGRVTDAGLQELLGRCDIYVSTSVEEGFAISLIEAMAAGLPLIAVDKGAVPEVVPDGEVGLLYQPADVEGLAKAIVRLVEDPELRAAMGRAGRARSRAFDLNRGIEDFSRMYREIAGKV